MSTSINDDLPEPDASDRASADLDAEDESGGSTELDRDDADLSGSAFPPDNSFGQVPDFNE